MSKVIGKMVNELHDPGFEDRIRIAASTINADEETRDLNAKGLHMRRVIKMDAMLMKKRGRKSTFKSDIMFARSVIFGPPASDHAKHPQMGCGCYYCKKHWAKTGGQPCFIPPKAVAINKAILLIDGMLYLSALKSKLPTFDSVKVAPKVKSGVSTQSKPSTSSAQGTSF
ncbi:uncharacterized protein [Montipora capricornis]|uniref:uncharacterized protein n=1 Tax=Montipora capricornis TaxID=246305 RepID=UPI0035F13415